MLYSLCGHQPFINRYPILLLLIQVSFSPIMLIGQITAHQLSQIDQIVQAVAPNEPGFAIGVVSKNELIYAKGAGLINLEQQIDFSPETPFYLASMTKEFIAAAVGLLILEGKLDLQENIQTYLPAFPSYDVPIHLEHLVYHTSGVKDYSNLMYFRNDSFEDFLSINQIIAFLRQQTSLNFSPGTEYLYSNSNYVLLAEIISEVSGQNFRQYIQEHIFNPLDMQHTHFVKQSVAPTAIGYQFSSEQGIVPFDRNNAPPVDQVQMISTIKDLSLWDQNFEHQKVGGPALQKLILKTGKLKNNTPIEYAFGLSISSTNNEPIVQHGGFMLGYQTNHTRFVNQGFSILVFSNSPKINTTQLTNRIADILIKVQAQKKQEEANFEFVLPKKIRKRYHGTYWSPKSKNVRVIYSDQGILRYNRPDRYSSRLAIKAEEDHTFYMTDGSNRILSEINFEFPKNAAPILNYRYLDSDRIVPMYAFEPLTYNAKELRTFSGVYFSEEISAEYKFEIDKEQLVLFVNGQQMSNLYSIKTNTFKDNRYGTFEFISKNGKIVGFYLSTERARNVLFSKK